MGRIVVLGAAFAVPDELSDNTHLVVLAGERTVLVDCASNPVVRLKRAGIDHNRVTDLILTHFHPDHVSGVALMLMSMWLTGRTQPLDVYGLDIVIERTITMMDLYDWKNWPNFFPVHFHRIPEVEQSLVFESPELRITGSPVKHLIPTMGLRFDFLNEGKAAAYSCDTEPCPAVARLAEGVDVLFHETAGAQKGHSSPGQAGEIAQKAEAGALYLIHYPPRKPVDEMVREAQTTFSGPVAAARDFMQIEL